MPVRSQPFLRQVATRVVVSFFGPSSKMTWTVASNTISRVLAERAWLGDFLGCDTLAFLLLICRASRHDQKSTQYLEANSALCYYRKRELWRSKLPKNLKIRGYQRLPLESSGAFAFAEGSSPQCRHRKKNE
jgi:hypothetical protein